MSGAERRQLLEAAYQEVRAHALRLAPWHCALPRHIERRVAWRSPPGLAPPQRMFGVKSTHCNSEDAADVCSFGQPQALQLQLLYGEVSLCWAVSV